jgi:hypothetical protein
MSIPKVRILTRAAAVPATRYLRAKVTCYRARGCSNIRAMAEAFLCHVPGKGTMTRFFAFCLLLLLGTFGAGLAAPPKPSGLPKLGIISAIGDKLYLRKVGLTVFENDAQEMAIDSWRLDDLMAAKVRAALTGRFDVRPVTYQRAPFASLAERNEIFAQEHRPELVRTGVSPQGLDGYLVITKIRSQYSQTNQTLLGFGVIEGGTKLFGTQLYAYANYALAMVDGRSFSITEQAAAFLPPRARSEIGGISGKVDKSLWPASPDAAANQGLKAALAELIDRSLPCGLQRMRLIPPVQACDATVTMPGRE